MRIEGSIITLTGGASGIGRVVAEELDAGGARIIVLDSDQEKLEELAEASPGISVLHCDVTKEDQINAAVQFIISEYSRIDVLINNAGSIHSELLINLVAKSRRHNVDNWRRILDTNLTSVFLVSSQIVEQMVLKRTKGLIINISSISAQGIEGQTAYSASKAGVESLTKVWAKELAVHGIRSVGIAPGFIQTESTRSAIGDYKLNDIKDEIFLKRLGNALEIAKSVFSVIENDFINNTIVEVNGGMCV